MCKPPNVITGEIRRLDLDRRTGRLQLFASSVEFVCVPAVVDELKKLFVAGVPCRLGGVWVEKELFDVWRVME